MARTDHRSGRSSRPSPRTSRGPARARPTPSAAADRGTGRVPRGPCAGTSTCGRSSRRSGRMSRSQISISCSRSSFCSSVRKNTGSKSGSSPDFASICNLCHTHSFAFVGSPRMILSRPRQENRRELLADLAERLAAGLVDRPAVRLGRPFRTHDRRPATARSRPARRGPESAGPYRARRRAARGRCGVQRTRTRRRRAPCRSPPGRPARTAPGPAGTVERLHHPAALGMEEDRRLQAVTGRRPRLSEDALHQWM